MQLFVYYNTVVLPNNKSRKLNYMAIAHSGTNEMNDGHCSTPTKYENVDMQDGPFTTPLQSRRGEDDQTFIFDFTNQTRS